MSDWLMAYLFLPLIFGVLIYALDRVWFSRFIFVMQSVLTAGFMGLLSQTGQQVVIGGWEQTIGIEFILSPIGLLFVAMTLISFWFIILYDWSQKKKDHKYLFLICVLESVMLSLFMVNDLFTLFILIELMTITASILITYKKDSASIKAGIYYLLINSLGMVLYIMGVMILYSLTGSLNIDEVVLQMPLILDAKLFKLAMAFIVTSLAVKSAWFPLFHWLPIAHSAAPGSISALLSGLIVKAGLFILIRISAIVYCCHIGDILVLIGISTALIGVLLATLQSDIKRILSFHTVSQVGLILVGLSVPDTLASFGGVLHIFNHFLFKSLLFLCAGLILTQTGERNLKKISGLIKINPVLSFCLLIGMLGITGFPLFNGQLSKILIKSASQSLWLDIGLQIVNVGTLVSFMKLSQVFFGPKMKQVSNPKPRQVAIYLMSFLTVVALPLELLFFKNYKPEALSYFMKKVTSNSIEFALYALIAYGIYKYILVPAIHRNSQTLQKIKAFGLAYFSESVALLLAFLGVLHSVLSNIKG